MYFAQCHSCLFFKLPEPLHRSIQNDFMTNHIKEFNSRTKNWYTVHITNDETGLFNIRPCKFNVTVGDRFSVKCKKIGDLKVFIEMGIFLGYLPNHRPGTWKFYSITSNSILKSRDNMAKFIIRRIY